MDHGAAGNGPGRDSQPRPAPTRPPRRRPGARAATAALLLLAGCASGGPYGGPAGRFGAAMAHRYRVYVADRSSDEVSRIRFEADRGAVVEASVTVGLMPVDLDAPLGLAVSPDGRWWYVTTQRGAPEGRLWKFRAGTDTLAGSVPVGVAPGAVALAPDGGLALVADVGPAGAPGGEISLAATEPVVASMDRIRTCPHPDAVRVGPDGGRAYVVCADRDSLIELSVPDRHVAREVYVGPPSGRCGPTWTEPSADGEHVYVACGRDSTVVELETDGLTVSRRLPVGSHPTALAVTRDGRWLLAVDRAASAVSLVDLSDGTEAARMPTSRPLPHGIVTSPDSRFAFVTDESGAASRGAVDVFDLGKKSRVASVEVGLQPTGIGFWSMEAVRRPGLERFRRPERGEAGEGGEGGEGGEPGGIGP